MELQDVAVTALKQIRGICKRLPEVAEVETPIGVDFRVRRRSFVNLFTVMDRQERPVTMLVCRADEVEREFILAGGHPFFRPGSGKDRVGMVLTTGTDWAEVGELVTDSYCIVAPKTLASQVHRPD